MIDACAKIIQNRHDIEIYQTLAATKHMKVTKRIINYRIASHVVFIVQLCRFVKYRIGECCLFLERRHFGGSHTKRKKTTLSPRCIYTPLFTT